jgi:hypothetical protein
MAEPSTERKQAGSRLAFRQEGPELVAYLAQPHTMDGALRLASVHMSIVQQPGFHLAYVELMSQAYRSFVEAATGLKVESLSSMPVPEHERAGHA